LAPALLAKSGKLSVAGSPIRRGEADPAAVAAADP